MALLVPRDARDEGDLYLEIRAGTGGDEAAIFAGDLLRMYSRYAERQGWRVEIESARNGEPGGIREGIAREIGSASGRDSVWRAVLIRVGAGSVKKKRKNK